MIRFVVKKLLSLLLAVTFMTSLAACAQTSEEENVSSDVSSDGMDSAVLTNFTGYGEHADTLMATLKDTFWMLTADKLKEGVNSTDPVTLWGYAAYMEAVGQQLTLHPDDAEVKEEYLKTLNSVEYYRANWRDDGLQVYQTWAGDSKAECYYDDDVWVVLEFINAYGLLDDSYWLSQAEGTAEFCYSGWDDQLGGGVYWKEDDKSSKNTCINAPLALASCELYNATGNSYYLDWAKKLYDWTKDTLLDESDNTFWDNINVNGTVDKAKYTYNTGNMIASAAALYRITGDNAYLTDAKNYAEGAYNYFGKLTTVDGLSDPLYVCDSNAWFGGSLLKGYLALYQIDSSETKYVESYAQCLAYSCLISNDVRGYLVSGWTQAGLTQNPSLLDQSGNARLLYLLQIWKNAQQ